MIYQHKTSSHHRTIIAFAIMFVAGFIAYDHVAVRYTRAADAPPLTSSATDAAADASAQTSALTPEQAALLSKIQKIKLDSAIFRDPSFLSFVNWTVKLDHIDAGRPNPFAPYSGAAAKTPAPKR